MKTISWSQAFAHCASTGSYWLWLVIGVLFFIGTVIAFVRSAREGNAWSPLYLFIGLLILGLSISYRPGEIKANTSQEQASRGVYIGY